VTALAHSLARRRRLHSIAGADLILIALGAGLVAVLAQLSIRLPYTPVPVTGQTLGVLVVGASLGPVRGTASLLLYLAVGALGAPVFGESQSGADVLALSSATAGYLWGFVVAAGTVGLLARRASSQGMMSTLGAMLVGEIIIFAFGVTWLSAALDVPGQKALELGLYPFLLGDLLKLVLAAAGMPLAWRLIGRRDLLG
jgi:biotin transport system substrate-specific component